MSTRYATLENRNRLSRRIADMDSCKANPIAWEKIQDKRAFERDYTKTQTMLTEVTPPDIPDASAKAKVKERISKLTAAVVNGSQAVVPMPSRRDMWEDTANAVDRHLQHEKYWKRHTLDAAGNPILAPRGALFELKDLWRTVGKADGLEEDSPNIANIEQIRPADRHTPLADQRTPRSYGLTPQAREMYDETFPDHELTPVERKLNEPVVIDQVQPVSRPRARRKIVNPCIAIKINGKPCGLESMKNSNYCFRPGHRQLAKQEVRNGTSISLS